MKSKYTDDSRLVQDENFLEETLIDLRQHGKSPEDVLWVGDRQGKEALSWQEFSRMGNFDYDPGFGSKIVRLDLVVVGEDWWLERHEYDGSERWEFKQTPTLSAYPGGMSTLLANPWSYKEIKVRGALKGV